MDNDPVRKKIRDLLWKRGLNMREVSVAIGRNVSYMHGFLERGIPKVLSYQDAHNLAGVIGCTAEELHHAERPPRRKRTLRRSGPGAPHVPLSAIPELDVDDDAGPGALAGESVAEKARWHLPEGMIRYEAGASPDAIRVLRVRGVSMQPELSDGDRLLVDISRRVPATGEMFVLWDGGGLVVKRVEPMIGTRPESALRLKSTNPDYDDYTVLACDVHIVGKVLWTVKKV